MKVKDLYLLEAFSNRFDLVYIEMASLVKQHKFPINQHYLCPLITQEVLLLGELLRELTPIYQDLHQAQLDENIDLGLALRKLKSVRSKK